jgi:hypothetical protein
MDEGIGSRRIAGAIRHSKRSAKLIFLSISSLIMYSNIRKGVSDEPLTLVRRKDISAFESANTSHLKSILESQFLSIKWKIDQVNIFI